MKRFLPFIFLFLTALPTQAFEAPAHIAICELAWQQVQPDTREWLQQVIKNSPQKRFNSGCIWPDQVRKESSMEHTKVWHYINVDRSATEVHRHDCPEQGCITQAIRDMRERLINNPNDWQALLFIGHFMADIHQPMHVSYADDRGGNRSSIRYLGDKTNLHRLWDGDLLGKFRISELVAELQPLPQPVPDINTPEQWATGSLQLTRKIYSAYEQSRNAGDEYTRLFRPQLHSRMQLAAARLASLRDEIHDQVTKPSSTD